MSFLLSFLTYKTGYDALDSTIDIHMYDNSKCGITGCIINSIS